MLFLDEEIFDGDLTRQRHEQSVPKLLFRLISMILQGNEMEGNQATDPQKKIAINLSELIRCYIILISVTGVE